MANLRVKLNRKGVRELMKSQELLDACVEVAKAKAAQAGDGYEADGGQVGKTRVSARVYPASAAARSDNSRNNTLLKVFGASLKVRDGS